jgi:hypothetical protein
MPGGNNLNYAMNHSLIHTSQPVVSHFVAHDGGPGDPSSGFMPLIGAEGPVVANLCALEHPCPSQRKNKASEVKYASSKTDTRNELANFRSFYYAVEGITPSRKENTAAHLNMFYLENAR